ncbi:hypothetical protein [Staphylococcus pseudintermedius]|uniref:hypothetical protein n=1 Tax=Staphylococcus pseudintermedius TaxID=283734 RepID=UPI00223EC57C|nr:hypothetical protein [Staphylococcus pseudintermedius]
MARYTVFTLDGFLHCHSSHISTEIVRVGLDFEPEAIHIMVPGETEEEFDKRIEGYGDLNHETY